MIYRNYKFEIKFIGLPLLFATDLTRMVTINSLASSIIKDNFGYINSSGKLIISANYIRGTEFREGLAAVKDDSGWHYTDKQGNIVFNAIGVSSNYAIIRMEFRNTGRLNVGINGSTGSASTLAGWNPIAFNESTFDICRLAKANLAELIMYNRVLFDSEWSQVNDYLNTKYKIY